jgi:hypothetical protein
VASTERTLGDWSGAMQARTTRQETIQAYYSILYNFLLLFAPSSNYTFDRMAGFVWTIVR